MKGSIFLTGALSKQFLAAICEYLRERNLTVELYSGYMSVLRYRHLMQIGVDDAMVRVEVYGKNPYSTKRSRSYDYWSASACEVREFDLSHPNSLEAICQFVSAKVRK